VKAPKAPAPVAAPDPKATASAQAGSNAATAITQQTMNMVDQYTPDGSLVYEKIGEQNISDGMGGNINAPRYKATQTLSPEQETLRKLGLETETGMATIARDHTARIGSVLGKPLDFGPDFMDGKDVDLSNEAVEARLYELGSKRLDPRFASEQESLRTRLLNSGVREGSDAYDAAIRNFTEGKNDAYNNLLLTGRGQSVNEILAARNQSLTERQQRNTEMLTERNQPINEITALMSGSQVSQPQFVNTPNVNVAGVDYMGATQFAHNSQVQQQQNAYNQKMASHNAMMGGLFGMAGTGMTAGIKYGFPGRTA
jgi:hypothetical protein